MLFNYTQFQIPQQAVYKSIPINKSQLLQINSVTLYVYAKMLQTKVGTQCDPSHPCWQHVTVNMP